MPTSVRRSAELLFWGSLIVVLDIRIEGFDLINDVVGMVLVVIGLSALAKLPGEPAHSHFSSALALGYVSLALSVLLQLLVLGDGQRVLGLVEAIVAIIGVVMLTLGMRTLALDEELEKLAASWERARLWVIGSGCAAVASAAIPFLLIVALPFGLAAFVMLLITLRRTSHATYAVTTQ